ncbi:similar to Saccharomyces cerevisiae YPR072W NOT5 Subunit of the CCR4-NOT complex [Maudiozyma barnettii]|uniref:General negative regulator of transcription subunit n=1 Tax=Maudiozyma barnettii TaxID=61262 RepID=A0A8H2ZG61_9SACH|nr:CCR4-NOT core subunit NOT5 [Kazachstania barnettii]CAB4253075.1 similar to Saccharomyces cerevisiae YPR072W NOT5 Subunit of the CCR4-NOT complex [Kazachstania barnettii]CAD1780390.1 similar to Saccharomyces cerevisiae YPR072W NOT5 Subunit of the CCR4-NOT complex [Kazachstania barnettii]
MSQKKLNQEIDKLLKKVKEGLEEFDIIHDKFQITDPQNTSYREKLESDLKREIKKLQKHREQIKTWISKEDVKDKASILLEHRRLVENDMERFKTIEKLMKTKQFSKEALSNPDIILDPRDAHKNNQMQFIQDSLNELQKQTEIYEGQLEANNDGDGDLDEDDVSSVEFQISRHEFHIANLENILKLLQNNEMDPKKVDEFQEDITYYVENNDDPDFVEYDTLYEDMGCEVSTNGVSKTNIDDINIDESTIVATTHNNNTNTNNGTGITPVTTATTAASTKNDEPATTTATITTTTTTKSEKSPRKKKQVLKDFASNASTLSKLEAEKTTTGPTNDGSQPSTSVATSSNMKSKPEVKDQLELEFPKDKSEEIEKQLQNDIESNDAFKNPLFSEELKFWLNSKRALLQPHQDMPSTMLQQLESSLLNCPDSLDADSPYLYKKPLSLPHPTSIFFPSEPIRFTHQVEIKPITNDSKDNEHQNNISTDNNSNNNNIDEDNNRRLKKTETQTNDIYSNTSMARILTKFDLDTLFFIFYHYQGTYEQFLSARELHRNRNWVFNKVDRCWYYKEIEKLPPGMNRSEEESWRYFDYKKSWLSRRCGPGFVYKEEEFEKL